MDNRRNDPHLNRALAEREANTVRRSGMDNAVIVRGVSQIEEAGPAQSPDSGAPGEPRFTTASTSARQCWICFASDEEDARMAWIQPCNCKGTTKWVHQVCLQVWIDEKIKEDRERTIVCPQCRTEYLIYYPNANFLVRFLDQLDTLIYKTCPFVVGCYVVGAVYWTALSYGAVTFLQVGDEESKDIMGNVHPFLMLVTLPVIPGVIVILGMLKWEESVLDFLRAITEYVPLTHYVLPNRLTNESGVPTERQISDGMSCTRVFAGAILLPVAAKISGDILYKSVESTLLRSLFGGLTFIGVKGLVMMYHKQQTYKRLSHRRILDYTEENRQFIGSESLQSDN